jgi:DNA-directed RNA polymerase sigma subunit (sigma70/sigma32)
MTMRTLNIGFGGLKLEANFDLGVGESVDFSILTDRSRIQCKGRILAIEESGNKIQARLRFAPSSDWEYGKLSKYLHVLSRKPLLKGPTGNPASQLSGITRHAMKKGVKLAKTIFREDHEDRKLRMVNAWLALLTDMERTVIALRFGLHGQEVHRPESIGTRLGLSAEAVAQIEAEAIEKLRRMSRKKEIDLDDII